MTQGWGATSFGSPLQLRSNVSHCSTGSGPVPPWQTTWPPTHQLSPNSHTPTSVAPRAATAPGTATHAEIPRLGDHEAARTRFYTLRAAKLKVSVTEYLSLLEALQVRADDAAFAARIAPLFASQQAHWPPAYRDGVARNRALTLALLTASWLMAFFVLAVLTAFYFSALLFTRRLGVPVAALMDGVDVGRGARLRKVIADKGVKIPPRVEIGFDPENDRKRFHVSGGGVVVLPKGVVVPPA